MSPSSSSPHFSEERIFTLADVWRLFRKYRLSLFKASLLGAVFALWFQLKKEPVYQIEATFQEAAETSQGDFRIQDLLMGGGAPASSAPALMQSYAVLKPLAERLGLQATVPLGGKIVSRTYRHIKDNWLAEKQRLLKDLDPFRFENVVYEGEQSLRFWLLFEDPSSFSILDEAKRPIAKGRLGEEVVLPQVRLTLVKTPSSLRTNYFYALCISPWLSAAKNIRSLVKIAPYKLNQSIHELSLRHRDRLFGQKLLNELMEEYRRFLKRDHDEVAQEQLAYLEAKQGQVYHTVETLLDEQVASMSSNIAERGILGLNDQAGMVLLPLQRMVEKKQQFEVDLLRLDQAQEQGEIPLFSEHPLLGSLYSLIDEMETLRQQRNLWELSLLKKGSPSEERLFQQSEELGHIRAQRRATEKLLEAVRKEIPIDACPTLGEIETTLDFWATHLQEEGGRKDFTHYLEGKARLLAMQEGILQEHIVHSGGGEPNPFEGFDLKTIRSVFTRYSEDIDTSEARDRYLAQLIEEIEREDFAISSLNTVLSDALSRKLIEEASNVSISLKNEKYRSEKERERWTEELAIQKKILKEHLEQLRKVIAIELALRREKISSLQEVGIGCIQERLTVLQEQVRRITQEARSSLSLEKKLLEGQIAQLREETSAALPDLWRREKLFNIKAAMGEQMMGKFTELIESKTLGHHLHHIQSKPLDLATLPTTPLKPRLLAMSCFGAFGAAFGLFLFRLIQAILFGFPTSLDILQARNFPLLGSISHKTDGAVEGPIPGSDWETLRRIGLFLDAPSRAKKIALLAGKGPDYSYALAEQLARRSLRSIIVRCDFPQKFDETDCPGLLQLEASEKIDSLIQKKSSFDVIPSGGYTPYGMEIIQGAPFQKLLDELVCRYDAIFLLFRSPLDHPVSEVALRLTDKAIATISGERMEYLTPLARQAYDKGNERLQFITSQIL